MIRFFNVNDPYRLIFVFLIFLVGRVVYLLYGLPMTFQEYKFLTLGAWLSSGFTMYSETFDYTAPFSAWTYEFLHFIFGNSRGVHFMLSTLLIFIQASLFNLIINRNKVFSEPNYYVAFIYVVLSFLSLDFFSLSPQLMSLTWVLLAMGNLVRRLDNQISDPLFLISGFYLGIASLFYMPTILFFITFLFSMMTIIRAVLRRILLFIYGFISVFLVLEIILVFQNNSYDFWNVYFFELFHRPESVGISRNVMIWISIPILIFIFSLLQSFIHIKSRLFSLTNQFMLLVFFTIVIMIIIRNDYFGVHGVFFLPCFAFFITDYFIHIKKKYIRFIIPNVLIILLFITPFFHLQYGDTQHLILKPDKKERESKISATRILYFGNVREASSHGYVLTPCLNEEITNERIRDLDDYHQSEIWLSFFMKIRPELVIDQKNILEKIEYRFPKLPQLAYKKINN